MISPGLTIIWVYVGVTYLLPWIYNSIFDLQFVSSYRIYPLHGSALVFILAFAFALLVFDRKPGRGAKPAGDFLSNPRAENWRLIVAIVTFGLALIGKRSGLNSYRYGAESAFVGGISLVYFFALIPMILKFDLLYHLFSMEVETSSSNRNRARASRFFFLASAVLSVNGVATALFTMVYSFYAVAPRAFRGFFLRSNPRRKDRFNFKWLAPILFLLICLGGWLIGETTKRGGEHEELVEDTLNCSTIECAAWAMERVSSSYFSLLKALDDNLLAADLNSFYYLLTPLRTLLYRLDVLLGSPLLMPKPQISSISRLNYEWLALDPKEREGTSPGLIGSFLICFPFPLNLVVLLAYTLFLIGCLNRFFQSIPVKPGLLGLILMLWLILRLFESPIDLLVLVDDASLSILLLIIAYLKICRKNVERGPRVTGNISEAVV